MRATEANGLTWIMHVSVACYSGQFNPPSDPMDVNATYTEVLRTAHTAENSRVKMLSVRIPLFSNESPEIAFSPGNLFPNNTLSVFYLVYYSSSETQDSHAALLVFGKSVNSGASRATAPPTGDINASPRATVDAVPAVYV